MIKRNNWLDVTEYLNFHRRILQRSDETIKRKRGHLRHFLEWADEIAFQNADQIDPVFPQYILSARNDGKEKPLSATSMQRACREARGFYSWAFIAHHQKYQSVPQYWVESLRLSCSKGEQSQLREIKVFPLEKVRAILAFQPRTLREKRDQAATAFLFLSAIRAGAFVTLPIHCVNIEEQTIKQLPKHGVHTKNHKAAITSMLTIPDLIEVVEEWDTLVRDALPHNAPWYPPLNSDGMQFTNWMKPSANRRDRLADGLQKLCAKVNVTYSYPHSLRNSHAVYALKNVSTIEELKAVSQNLMHNSLTTTEAIYARLVHDDVHEIVTTLGYIDRAASSSPKLPRSLDDEKLKLIFQILQKKPEVIDGIFSIIRGRKRGSQECCALQRTPHPSFLRRYD